MLVSEAITQLKTSEVKQLGLKDSDADILGFINFGILELYKRFPLWEAEAVITQATDVVLYTLADGAANVVIDLSDHNLLTILKVWDEDDNFYIINNEKDPDSLKTPKYNQLKVAAASVVDGYVMTVDYRAAPLFLTSVSDVIPLPVQFLEALFTYVGYKGQSSVKVGVKDENNAHYIRFEAACERIKTEGLFAGNDLESTKFEQSTYV